MGIFKKRAEREPENDRPFAHRIEFEGPAPYGKSFEGTSFGVVFEDDGATGYLYATNESHDKVLDALHLYDTGGADQVKPGEEVFVVWNGTLQKAGVFYHGRLHAVIDFRNREARCRTNSPPLHTGWCKSSHEWSETIVRGLEP